MVKDENLSCWSAFASFYTYSATLNLSTQFCTLLSSSRQGDLVCWSVSKHFMILDKRFRLYIKCSFYIHISQDRKLHQDQLNYYWTIHNDLFFIKRKILFLVIEKYHSGKTLNVDWRLSLSSQFENHMITSTNSVSKYLFTGFFRLVE